MDVMAQVPLLEKVLGRFYRVMDGLGHPCSFGLFRSSPCFHCKSTISMAIYHSYVNVYQGASLSHGGPGLDDSLPCHQRCRPGHCAATAL